MSTTSKAAIKSKLAIAISDCNNGPAIQVPLAFLKPGCCLPVRSTLFKISNWHIQLRISLHKNLRHTTKVWNWSVIFNHMFAPFLCTGIVYNLCYILKCDKAPFHFYHQEENLFELVIQYLSLFWGKMGTRLVSLIYCEPFLKSNELLII